ncbi:MAG: dienelactone hydrolase family protein [Candidatus Methanoperedens sp.]|nr:dienelactone hydrolase family protein [Candidatus Methanoperedens sp.]
MTYPAYLAAPSEEARKPAIVLVHSNRGLEPGYRNLTDRLASEGYIVLALQWQTFEQSPGDETIELLLRDSVAYLRTRQDVSSNIGLTGFCAGGRYTMLFLPQIDEFKSGVAFYGFPYRGSANQSMPADMIEQLKAPLLIIHGTHDQGSPIADIYRYATALNASGKYFELKVYQGQPHGFMIENGELSQSFAAKNAYTEMVTFFDRTLRE